MNIPGVPAGLLDNLPGVPHGFVESVLGVLTSVQKEFAATIAEATKPDPRTKRHHLGTVTAYNPMGPDGIPVATVDLDGSGVEHDFPFLDSFGGIDPATGHKAIPQPDDVVHVEFVGSVGWVIDRLRQS